MGLKGIHDIAVRVTSISQRQGANTHCDDDDYDDMLCDWDEWSLHIGTHLHFVLHVLSVITNDPVGIPRHT